LTIFDGIIGRCSIVNCHACQIAENGYHKCNIKCRRWGVCSIWNEKKIIISQCIQGNMYRGQIHPRVSYSLRATLGGNMILVGEYIFIFPEPACYKCFVIPNETKTTHTCKILLAKPLLSHQIVCWIHYLIIVRCLNEKFHFCNTWFWKLLYCLLNSYKYNKL
jgi:hypothetical protein